MFRPLLLPVLLLSSGAYAQTAGAPDAAADPNADAIIVSATRTPTPIDQVSSSVTVLDKAAIDRTQDIGVTELLARTPGVSFSRNGGYGTDTTLRIRGAEGDQTVLVLDGVKMSDPASPDGSYNFGNLLVEDAARVEVLRGPQSTLWGSQAIGGGVNIVTGLPTKPLEGSIDIEAGSRATVNARAGVGGKDGRVTWRLAAESFTTNGISALDHRFGGREPDGYTNRALQGRVLVTLMDGVTADLRGYYASSRTDIDGYDANFNRADTPEFGTNKQWFGYGGLNIDLFGGRLRNRIGYSLSETWRVNYDPRYGAGEQRTFIGYGRTGHAEYQGTLAITKGWNAVFGVENERSRFRSSAPAFGQIIPDLGQATLTDEYLQVNGEILSGLTLMGGVRHDHYSSYGSRFLFSGGAAWKLSTGTVLRANWGEGFKAPSLYQLFSEYGNQALKPTESQGWEAGVEQHFLSDKVQIAGTYFQRRSRQQIIFTSLNTYPYGIYQNLSRSFARGVELVGAIRPVKRLSLDGNYSWTLAEDRSPGATYGNWLPRRPRREANGSISYQWPCGLVTSAAMRWAGHSFDTIANTQVLASYTLVDLRVEMPVLQRFTVFARVENVGNTHYETAYTYGTLGRSVYAGFRARL